MQKTEVQPPKQADKLLAVGEWELVVFLFSYFLFNF